MEKRSYNEEDLLKQLVIERIEQSIIYEGLVFSYPYVFVFKKLQENGYDVSYNGDKFTIRFNLDSENKKRYQDLNHFMDTICGWKHAASIAGGQVMGDALGFLNEKAGMVTLQFEPKFDVELSKVPPIVYHGTTMNKLKKITGIGLSPRDSDNYFCFNHRIYFAKSIEGAHDFIKKKFDANNREGETIFVILEISTKSRNKFFKDINFQDGIYTMENIHPFSIKPIEKIELNIEGNIINQEQI